MSPLELAHAYLKTVFSGKNVDDLNRVLADDLEFRGPWFQFDSAQEYINSLKKTPFIDAKYNILHSWENESSASIFYQFSKPDVSTPMALSVQVDDGKINKILFIFDTKAFS